MKEILRVRLESFTIIGGIIVIVAAIAMHAVTALWDPMWTDDVMQIEPAVNWLLGRGFVSFAQPSHPGDALYAANNAFYPFMLVPWLKMFGLNLTATKVFNQLLCLLAIFIASAGLYKTGVFRTRAIQCMAIAVAFCLGSVAYVYRSGRADSATMLSCSLIVYTYCLVRTARISFWWLIVPALLVVPSGIHAIPYIVILVFFAFVIDKTFRVMHAVMVVFGIALGMVALLAYYASQGVAAAFIQTNFGTSTHLLGSIAQASIIHDAKSLERLVAILQTLAPLAVLKSILIECTGNFLIFAMAAVALTTKDDAIRKKSLIGLLIAGLVPLGLHMAGHYAYYYAWMAGVPIAFCFCAMLQSGIEQPNSSSRNWLLAAVAFAACLQGLPMYVLSSFQGYGPQGYAQTVTMCKEVLRKNDVVCGDQSIYFQVKERKLDYYAPTYSGGRGYLKMSEAERQSITIMILKKEDMEQAVTKIGGEWANVKMYDQNINMSGPTDRKKTFVVARRVSADSVTSVQIEK